MSSALRGCYICFSFDDEPLSPGAGTPQDFLDRKASGSPESVSWT